MNQTGGAGQTDVNLALAMLPALFGMLVDRLPLDVVFDVLGVMNLVKRA